MTFKVVVSVRGLRALPAAWRDLKPSLEVISIDEFNLRRGRFERRVKRLHHVRRAFERGRSWRHPRLLGDFYWTAAGAEDRSNAVSYKSSSWRTRPEPIALAPSGVVRRINRSSGKPTRFSAVIIPVNPAPHVR